MTADVKTLRLATLQLTKEHLDAHVTYLRTVLSSLEKNASADAFAAAHARGVTAAGLDALELQKVRAVVDDYCRLRSAALTVRARIEALGNVPPTSRDAATLERARHGLPKLENINDFKARHGVEAVALLEGRESELLGLYRQQAAATLGLTPR